MGTEFVLQKITAKIVIVSNPKIFRLYGEKVQRSLENAGFEVVCLVDERWRKI